MINQSPENLKAVDNGRQNPTLKQLGEELGMREAAGKSLR
jgi:hypothetical protein